MGFFYSGGGERTVLNQAQGLQQMGHDVCVYAPTVSDDCFPELQNGLEIIELNEWIPKDLAYRSAIGMVASSLNIPYDQLKRNDVIIAHAQPSNWIAYMLRKKYGIPYLAYLHQVNRFFKPRKIDIESGWDTNDNISLLRFLHKGNFVIKYIDEISVKSANMVLTNSAWIKRQIKSYYDLTPNVCYPGVDLHKFTYHVPSKNDRYILSTNRHFPQKRIDYVIHCMKGISESFEDVYCIVTGGFTKHTAELIALRDKLGLDDKVFFTGNVETKKLIKLYENAYTYAYTSPEEDFGLGPVESGACGTPSIVWDYAGPKETVMDGVTGYRIEPYDVKKMTDKHILLLEDPDLRDSLGKNASSYVNNNFSWNKHCRKLLDYSNEII